MRAAIVSGAPGTKLNPQEFLNDPDLFIIGADRGALVLLEHGITPHLAVGDFDSVSLAQLEHIRLNSQELLLARAEKDETDTELALSLAIEKQAEEIFLYGGLGGRLDHSIANIRLLLRYAKQGIAITLLEASNQLQVFAPGSYHLPKSRFKYLSFFAMEEKVTELCLEGVKYPLEGAILAQEDTICISNEVIAETFTVAFATGFLLVVQSSDL